MKIGLFGGTFDPIHFGHLCLAEEVKESLELDKVIFIPSAAPPHKNNKVVAPTQLRFKMVQLATQDNPCFEVSKIELERSKLSYSIDTVSEFKQQFPKDFFYFILGSDSLFELHTWYEIDELIRLCPFVFAHRPGFLTQGKKARDFKLKPQTFRIVTENLVKMTPMGISSTEIRQRVAQGRSIRYLVPERVREFIEKEKLYRKRRSS